MITFSDLIFFSYSSYYCYCFPRFFDDQNIWRITFNALLVKKKYQYKYYIILKKTPDFGNSKTSFFSISCTVEIPLFKLLHVIFSLYFKLSSLLRSVITHLIKWSDFYILPGRQNRSMCHRDLSSMSAFTIYFVVNRPPLQNHSCIVKVIFSWCVFIRKCSFSCRAVNKCTEILSETFSAAPAVPHPCQLSM